MKRLLIIILIIVLVIGGFFYFSNRKTTTNTDGTKSGFRSFFNFGSKNTTTTDEPGKETGGEFTQEENPDANNTNTTPEQTPSTNSVFGTNGPFTPTMQGGLTENGGISGGGQTGAGGISGGGGVTGGGNTGVGGSGGSGNTNQCGADDSAIEFTVEEIARLRALEDRFYDLAPTLRSQADVQSELANYGSYKLLNQKYTELINYCESKSPLLPSNINKRVSTPLYTNTSASAYFSEGPDADGAIDMQSSTQKPKEVERFFRINIW
jgi:hypothetical protein